MGKKITIVGGGSSSFVPLLLRRLIESESLGDSQVMLMDVDEQRVKVMESLGQKLITSEGSKLSVRSSLDQREALDRRGFRDRGDLGRRNGRVGRRPRDSRPLWDRDARRRFDWAGRDLAGVP